ncbi:DUF402 domain-containing protein [Deinococcus peraridilitoris]|uniref:DUF402 domain-containing protein n=1 Tax=Deinococcus peraridilitoris (strain DSM 19664 / LMG 22246 / CIP 109416 / KR-200) TaxID=937777 RepID=L0A2C6_DEIPD|nr:DUF402 domain-containing protein [Deinococcus peraridilitoris]AFZ68053.1 hypothetical protein Deipe_2588 [Deinococcus peraridilitoris DSM 19664]
MPRKRFDKRDWHRVPAGGTQLVRDTPRGLLVDYTAGRVTLPLTVPFRERRLTILDDHYRWVFLLPHASGPAVRHALTLQCDAQGRVVQVYVDVIGDGGRDEDGLPWTLDLYLDVIAVVDDEGRVLDAEIIDADDLAKAVRDGRLDEATASRAWVEARRIHAELLAGQFELLAWLLVQLREGNASERLVELP